MMAKYIPERSCDFTDYPNLFKGTYWGCYNQLCEYERNNETIIGINRNKLVELYNLKRVIVGRGITKNIKKQSELIINGDDIRDHIEYYKTNDNKILTLFSYHGYGSRHCEFIIQQGYIEFDPLYSIGQQSYFKILQ